MSDHADVKCNVYGTRFCPDPKLIRKPRDAQRALAKCAVAGCPPRNWGSERPDCAAAAPDTEETR